MAEVTVKATFHFTFDPSKVELGQFEFPEIVMETISAGLGCIETSKVRIEDVPPGLLPKIEVQMKKAIIDAHKTATPLKGKAEATKLSKPETQPQAATTSSPIATSTGISLFD